jgi:hypothetical protein
VKKYYPLLFFVGMLLVFDLAFSLLSTCQKIGQGAAAQSGYQNNCTPFGGVVPWIVGVTFHPVNIFLETYEHSLIAGFTIVLGISTVLLWTVTKTAADAARIAAEHIPIVERAWIFCEPADIRQIDYEHISFALNIKNHGKTPGFLKAIWAEVRNDEPFDPNPTYLGRQGTQTNVVLSAGETRPSADLMYAGTERYLYGYARYTDIFNEIQVTRFCFLLEPESRQISMAGHPAWNAHYTEK